MSFETINIVRQLPIINNFVQTPNNLEKNKSAISLEQALLSNPAIAIGRMHSGTGGARLAGGKHGIQEWLEICTENIAPVSIQCTETEDLKATLPSNTTIPDWDNPPPGEPEWNIG